MDENRGRSVVLFILMGLFFFVGILYAFVIAPNMNKESLGTSDLVLELPIQKKNLRYSENGIIPFCTDNSSSLTIEVADGTTVYSASDGIVVDNSNNIVVVEVLSGVYIEYSPISNYKVFKGDYVNTGGLIGKVSGSYFNFSIKDTNREIYNCPYNYLNDFGKSIVDEGMEIMGDQRVACQCNILNY